MAGPRDCPVCEAPDPEVSVRRDAIPVYQNVTYPSAEAARQAPRGAFALATCRRCGFSHNIAFEPALIVYDANYDNHVASAAFDLYYRELAQMLIDRFALTDGAVYDIGCGKGEFLEVLHALAPGIQAIGIDPSCTPRDEGRFKLIRSPFEPSLFAADAKLLIVRHVLEHIDRPVDFLRRLREAMPAAPLFIEVPDLDWILDNEAFWDFCYEHCNYFTRASLANACAAAGLAVEAQSRSFGDQYQWAICRPAAARGDLAAVGDAAGRAMAYSAREGAKIARVTALARDRGQVGIWGMATKGVILSNMIPPALISGGVDMNTAKQGRFAAGSAVPIRAPDWLLSQAAGSTVLVMNPNYAAEVAQIAERIGADVALETV